MGCLNTKASKEANTAAAEPEPVQVSGETSQATETVTKTAEDSTKNTANDTAKDSAKTTANDTAESGKAEAKE